jgi:hypothetical protein
MQVNASIDEADVGRIRPGQHVTFRVDAYPTDTFNGTVAQVRLQPQVVQNVTTYGTVIDVPNPDLKLKPGMTANVKVEIAKRSDVLRVPNAALRFRPTADVFAALNQPVPPEVQYGAGARGRNAQGGSNPQRGAGPTSAQQATPVPMNGEGYGPSTGARQSPSAGSGQSFDPARMMDRFKSMTPDEQQQFIARMKERKGRDACARREAEARRTADGSDDRRAVRAAAGRGIARPCLGVHGSSAEARRRAARDL